MFLALSVCLLFILLMQSVNEVQFSSTTPSSLLFALCPGCAATVIAPLTSIYTSL